MMTQKIAIVKLSELSEDTQDIMLDMSGHERSISCIEAREGFIVNVDFITHGKGKTSGISELDDIIKQVKEKDCDWIFFWDM